MGCLQQVKQFKKGECLMKEISITNKELIGFWNALHSVKSEPTFVKFNYAKSRTKAFLKDAISSLQEISTPSNEYQKYSRLVDKAMKDSYKKGKDGKRKLDDKGNPIVDEKKFNVKKEKLDEEYKNQIEEYKELQKKFDEQLDEKVSVKVFFCSIEDVPPIPEEYMDILYYMFKADGE